MCPRTIICFRGVSGSYVRLPRASRLTGIEQKTVHRGSSKVSIVPSFSASNFSGTHSSRLPYSIPRARISFFDKYYFSDAFSERTPMGDCGNGCSGNGLKRSSEATPGGDLGAQEGHARLRPPEVIAGENRDQCWKCQAASRESKPNWTERRLRLQGSIPSMP